MLYIKTIIIALAGLATAVCGRASAQVAPHTMHFVQGCWMEKDADRGRRLQHFRLLPKHPWPENRDRRTLAGQVLLLD
jgi:hypothetical protein